MNKFLLLLALFTLSTTSFASSSEPFVTCINQTGQAGVDLFEMFVEEDRYGRIVITGSITYMDESVTNYISYSSKDKILEDVYKNEIHLIGRIKGNAYPRTLQFDVVKSNASLSGKNFLVNNVFKCNWIR